MWYNVEKKGGASLILTVSLNPSIGRRYNIKDFQLGKSFVATDIQYTAEGGGLNVMNVIKGFNVPVMVTGFLGGRNGDYIKKELDLMGIRQEFIPINEESRSSISIISENGISTKISERGPSISGNEVLAFYELYKEIIKEVDIICASGSLPHGLPPETYANLIIMAKEVGKKFFLDTSGEALKLGVDAKPFFVKPNREELEEIIGCKIQSEMELVQAGKYLAENDIEIVIISLGDEGSIAFHNGYIYRIRVPKIETINPAGSGDAMVGGFVASLYRDYDFEFALKVAAACGTANAMEKETGKVDMFNMKKIMKDVIITKSKF